MAYVFFGTALAIAVLGIGFYKLGPALDRWSRRLEEMAERMQHAGEARRLSDEREAERERVREIAARELAKYGQRRSK